MKITDDRNAGERERLDLALRLIRLQARTHIITFCTGFSQDRVRKLYATYFKHRDEQRVKRHRGKSPSSVEFFVRNPWTQAEASLLAHLFAAWPDAHPAGPARGALQNRRRGEFRATVVRGLRRVPRDQPRHRHQFRAYLEPAGRADRARGAVAAGLRGLQRLLRA